MSGLNSSNFSANEVSICGRVAANGSVTAGQGFSCSVSGAVFTLSFNKDYASCVACLVTGAENGAIGGLTTVTTDSDGRVTGVTITTEGHDGVDAAKAHSFLIILEE
ncbi:MAG: hypothetical protein CL398_07305 [Acidiferrobacteraceae bacterium]|nr:hypothetical protein [Acidiferrobacteraceae bacterium]|tara:strand:+ start:489 stop:809 length:321 start_codon:yes stop_codon:yes gene_type:complete